MLALLGGSPAFPDGLAFAKPPVPPRERVFELLAPSYDRGMLTNGPLVRELEERLAERFGVAHVVAVSNCTSGLMLALRVLAPAGPVLLPSFTFSASAHAVAWNGVDTRFCECDPDRFQMDLADARTRAEGIGAVMATHVFGAPCRPREVEALGAELGVPVVFDAAHGIGARHAGVPLGGFGDVEVFSMTPTKTLIAGEGGIVATNRDDLAAAIRIGRDYANPGDYDTRFVGMNARLSEMHAAVALASLETLDDQIARRRAVAARYTAVLAAVPGIHPQVVDPGDESSYKDFTIRVDADAYGAGRDDLVAALRAEGVDTRNYFDPPVHRQQSHARGLSLPVTERVAGSVVSLPIYPALTDEAIEAVAAVIAGVHAEAEAVRAARSGPGVGAAAH